MQTAMDETSRRQSIQKRYNRRHNITPTTIQKEISTGFESLYASGVDDKDKVAETVAPFGTEEELERSVRELEKRMTQAAKDLEFEEAAVLRDRINLLKQRMVFEI